MKISGALVREGDELSVDYYVPTASREMALADAHLEVARASLEKHAQALADAREERMRGQARVTGHIDDAAFFPKEKT